MKPVAIVATHPIQYQAPLYQHLTRAGLPIHVFFLSDRGLKEHFDAQFGQVVAWDVPLMDGYSHEFVPNLRSGNAGEHFFDLVNPRVFSRLLSRQYSAVVIHGYRNLSMLMALGGAKLARIPLLYRAETGNAEPGAIKRHVVGPAFRSVVSACLSIGSSNDSFYQSLGVPPDRRFLVPYAVDNERFQQAAMACSKEEARDNLGLPRESVVVLFSGKLGPWKQPDLLLRAFAAAAPRDAHLVFVGDGEMRSELERWSELHLPDRVTFLGFMNQSRIPLAYRSADLLVLPSPRETWGLVVNEAMNFGVPAVVSDGAGCAPDLITRGVTGEIFERGDCASLTEALQPLLGDPHRLEEMGGHALERIRRWGFAEDELGIRAALESVGV